MSDFAPESPGPPRYLVDPLWRHTTLARIQILRGGSAFQIQLYLSSRTGTWSVSQGDAGYEDPEGALLEYEELCTRNLRYQILLNALGQVGEIDVRYENEGRGFRVSCQLPDVDEPLVAGGPGEHLTLEQACLAVYGQLLTHMRTCLEVRRKEFKRVQEELAAQSTTSLLAEKGF